jgi:hypothetical protein
MNTLVLLMALVALSYVSGLFGRGRARRGLGLPSGSEWVLAGFLLGPDLLGVVDRGVQADVEPMAHVVVGWVALVIGLDYGVRRMRRLRAWRILLGALLGILLAAAIAGATWWSMPLFAPTLPAIDRWVLALGLAAVGTETTSNALRWVGERYGAQGPVSQMLADLAEAKDVVPILVAGVALCLHPRFSLGPVAEIAHWALPSAVVVTGAVLGLVAAVVLSREERADQAWGIVVGTSLLAIGTFARLGLPVVTALFALGLMIGVASRHRVRLLAVIDPTLRSALLPALLLAGARIGPKVVLAQLPWLAMVMAVRTVALTLIGRVLALRGPARPAAPLLGLSMLPAGEVSMTIGLGFAISCPGPIGDAVLVAAAGVTLLGELVGPLALRTALRRAGELSSSVTSNSVEILL